LVLVLIAARIINRLALGGPAMLQK